MSDLTGGIKNALDRGESLEKIKKSFLNAGYTKEEVEQATNEISPQAQFNKQQINQIPNKLQTPSQLQGLEIPSPIPHYAPLPTIPAQEEKKSHLLIIVLSILGLLILIGAGFLGLYWDKVLNFLGL